MSVAPNPPRESPREFLAQLLEEQNQLFTPVAEFSRAHERGEVTADRFARLLPVTPLSPGEQYAFEVDLDKCSGCKACVTACHSLNGLDDNETWREVGLLVEAPKTRRSRSAGFQPAVSPTLNRLTLESSMRLDNSGGTQAEGTAIRQTESLLYESTRGNGATLQHVTTACHHCVDPACLNGCPVLAYDKDPITGIVRHLDDQCIGCQYCVLKCPYDVPKYNERLGIVRKCDMCANRLAVGEAPACAQACPSKAIRITKVQTETVTIEFRERAVTFLAGAPAGFGEITPQPAHWPLVFMLVLTQASVGAACASVLNPSQSNPLLSALVFAMAGLGASVLHLGRPLGAWRGFLNFRRSWMSREIVAFGIYPALVAAALLFPPFAFAASGVGLAGVFCSAMIYADTRRELWHPRRSVSLFLFTTVLLGAGIALLFQPSNTSLALTLVCAACLKLLIEISVLRHVTQRSLTPMRKTALLITSTFQPLAFVRLICLTLGGIGLPVLLSSNVLPHPQVCAAVAVALLLVGELIERCLFFRTVVAPKMPGGLAS